jgi:hypothetical protein
VSLEDDLRQVEDERAALYTLARGASPPSQG